MENEFELPLININKLTPVEATKILFSYPYINIVPQFFLRSRDYDLGLDFVRECRGILKAFPDEFEKVDAELIEQNITFLELSMYDYLNLWQEYLDYFEQIFTYNRTSTFIRETRSTELDSVIYGRYLIGYNENGNALVHQLFYCEDRRKIIERKLNRYISGKSVEHLKRHQKDKLTDDEIDSRYKEMERLFNYIKGYKDNKE